MNTNVAALVATIVWHLESHGFGTTALIVLDGRPASRARCSMGTARSIRHGEDKVDICVERSGDLHVGNGEVLALTARNGRSTASLLRDLTLNTLGLEVISLEQRTLAVGDERVLAREAREVETYEAADSS